VGFIVNLKRIKAFTGLYPKFFLDMGSVENFLKFLKYDYDCVKNNSTRNGIFHLM